MNDWKKCLANDFIYSKITSFNRFWNLAPAYDLTFSTSSHGYHSTSIAGEGQNPGLTHLTKLAEIFGVQQANQIIEQVQSAIRKWEYFADEAKVTKASKQMIAKMIVK